MSAATGAVGVSHCPTNGAAGARKKDNRVAARVFGLIQGPIGGGVKVLCRNPVVGGQASAADARLTLRGVLATTGRSCGDAGAAEQ